MSREQVHAWPGYRRGLVTSEAGRLRVADIQPLPHLRCREAVSRLVPIANAAWYRLCGLYSMTAGVEVAA